MAKRADALARTLEAANEQRIDRTRQLALIFVAPRHAALMQKHCTANGRPLRILVLAKRFLCSRSGTHRRARWPSIASMSSTQPTTSSPATLRPLHVRSRRPSRRAPARRTRHCCGGGLAEHPLSRQRHRVIGCRPSGPSEAGPNASPLPFWLSRAAASRSTLGAGCTTQTPKLLCW
jgi:hypothetical protein